MRIGAGTTIGPHCVIEGHTTIGRDNRIFQFGSIGARAAGQEVRRRADASWRSATATPSASSAPSTSARSQDVGVTRIGDDNWIMAYVHIAHDCQVGNQTIIANNATLAGHVQLGDWVIVGGLTGVHQFVQDRRARDDRLCQRSLRRTCRPS